MLRLYLNSERFFPLMTQCISFTLLEFRQVVMARIRPRRRRSDLPRPSGDRHASTEIILKARIFVSGFLDTDNLSKDVWPSCLHPALVLILALPAACDPSYRAAVSSQG